MLNDNNFYNVGYSCGICTSYVCDIINCNGCCCWSSCFDFGKCLYEIYIDLCCNTQCDYEYCLMYCSGCYDGYSDPNTMNTTMNPTINPTNTTNTFDTNIDDIIR